MMFDSPGLHPEYTRSDPFAWAGLIAMVAAAYLAARVVTWLGLSVAFAGWTRCRDAHWTERARLAWPGRKVALLVPFLVPFPLLMVFIAPPIFLFQWGRDQRFGELLPRTAVISLFLAVGLLGVLQARSTWERRVNPARALTPGSWSGALVLGALGLAFWVWLPYALLGRILIGRGDLEAAVIGGGLLLIVAYYLGGGIVLLRLSGMLRPAPDRLRAIVAATSQRMGVRPPSAEVLTLPQANAIAFPLRRRIAVTDAALSVLDDDELSAVCAHELAHLSEPFRVGIARLLFGLRGILLLATVVLTISLTDRVFEFETGLAICVAADVVWLGDSSCITCCTVGWRSVPMPWPASTRVNRVLMPARWRSSTRPMQSPLPSMRGPRPTRIFTTG